MKNFNKQKVLWLCLMMLSATMMMGQNNPFITVWKPDNPSTTLSGKTPPTSSAQQIYFPGIGTNYTISWEEIGAEATHNGTITGVTSTKGNPVLINFNAPQASGTYRVKVLPTGFTAIQFTDHNSGTPHGDVQKIMDIAQWGDVTWKNMQAAFKGCSNMNMTATDAPNLSGVTDMRQMFSGASSFNGAVNHWNVNTITNMASMFNYATNFNQPLNNWNVSNVQTMYLMFSNAKAFNQPLNNWNVGKVTNMNNMFNGTDNFNQPLNSWNVSNVKSMQNMFQSALAFNQPLNNWNVSSVTDMAFMFQSAKAFNQPLSNWNVSSVKNMRAMFTNSSSFNQSLETWNLNSVTDINNMLNSSGLDCNNYSRTLIGWNANPNTPNGLTLGAGTLRYDDSANAARQNLITTKGWTILYESGGGCTYLWVGGTSGLENNWATPANWSGNTLLPEDKELIFATTDNNNGVPAQADLHVAGDKVVPGLENQSDKSLIIPTETSLTVTGGVTGYGTLADAPKLVIKADATNPNGSFIVTNGCGNNIYGTVELYAKSYKTGTTEWWDNIEGSPTKGQNFEAEDNWQYFGVPVESIEANPTFYGASLRIYYETQNADKCFYDKWLWLSNNSVLEAFKGYSITQPTTQTYSIAGKLLLCNTTVTMTRQAPIVQGATGNVQNVRYGLGQNLFGNSYTAAINITDLAATLPANVEKTIYLYNTGSFHDWTTGTLTTGTSPQLSAGNWFAIPTASAGAVWNNEIPSMQGFMLKFTDAELALGAGASQSVSIPYASLKNTKPQLVKEAVESADLARPTDLKSAEKSVAPLSYLRINLESASTRDALWLINQAGTTDHFDNGWDGRKYFGTPTAYIFTENKDGLMQVNADETIDGSLISFYANADTEYELTLIKSDLEQYDNLHLHDLVTKTSTALDTDTTYYRFTAINHGKVQKRFVILNNSELKLKDGSICLLDAYLKNNELLVISNLSGKEGQVSLYDTTGRLLFTQNMPTGIIEIPVNLSKGIYLVNLQAGGSRETVKIIVK